MRQWCLTANCMGGWVDGGDSNDGGLLWVDGGDSNDGGLYGWMGEIRMTADCMGGWVCGWMGDFDSEPNDAPQAHMTASAVSPLTATASESPDGEPHAPSLKC
jgi:hypothetical protein